MASNPRFNTDGLSSSMRNDFAMARRRLSADRYMAVALFYFKYSKNNFVINNIINLVIF
jgi:hypothetical protein